MKFLRAWGIAFSMYSQIPVPQFEWKEEDMKYAFCFFPWVGAVIGACMMGWCWVCRRLQVGEAAYILTGTALPLVITGGFHADGFMDTMDALHSYREKEKKLEILKDPHIGAFSVIMLLLYYLIYMAAFSEIKDLRTMGVVALGFVLSRALSGIGALVLMPAKKDGLLRTFSDAADRKIVVACLLAQALLCGAGMLLLSVKAGGAALAGAVASFFWYHRKTSREFGGVSGDTAGYFLLVCEGAIVVLAAVSGYIA